MKKTLAQSGLLAAVILGSSIFLLQGTVASADTTSTTSTSTSAELRIMDAVHGMDKNHDAVMSFLGIYGGRVTAVSGNTLTIESSGKTIQTVNASGATVMRDGIASTVSAIVVDDMLMIKGDLSVNTITASKIAAMPKPTKKAMNNIKKMMKDGMKDMKKGMKKDMKDMKDKIKIDSTTSTTTSTSTN